MRESVILDNTYVGQLVKLDHKVAQHAQLISVETGASVQLTDPFLLTEAGTPRLNHTLSNLLDRSIAGICLLLMAPLLLFIATVLFFTTNRRVLQQKAVIGARPGGKSGHPVRFYLTRFQTKTHAGKSSTFGHWLQRWDGDRLPELWHVLLGPNEIGRGFTIDN